MTRVKIDHDIPFENYNTSFVLKWLQKIPYPYTSVYMRKSCGGNTHVCVNVSMKLSPLDELMIRAILRDDARRVRGDLERYCLNSPVFGLLFDTKIDSEIKVVQKAGDWIKIK